MLEPPWDVQRTCPASTAADDSQCLAVDWPCSKSIDTIGPMAHSHTILENAVGLARALAGSLMSAMPERVGVHFSTNNVCRAGPSNMRVGSSSDSTLHEQ